MITKEQWLNLVSKVDQTFEDEFKAEYNSPELMYPVVHLLLKQNSVIGLRHLLYCTCEKPKIDYTDEMDKYCENCKKNLKQ